MISWWRRRLAVMATDDGAALLTVIGLVAVTTTLAVTAGTLSLNNVTNTTRDKQAGSALATSEAGVAEAIEYLRGGAALSELTCLEPAAGASPSGACLTNPAGWTSSTSPKQVRVDGGTGSCLPAETCYLVWIGTVQKYDPPVTREGIYRIHSTGRFGGGPAQRAVEVEVKVKPVPFPLGVFGETLTGGGSTGLHRESLFTKACVLQRAPDSSSGGGLRFDGGVDIAHDLPPAAHSSDRISTHTSCGSSRAIHSSSQPCNPTYPYDQSKEGGDLASTSCYRAWTSPLGTGKRYPEKSSFTEDDLANYGYRPRGLSDEIYANLRSRAIAAGTYFTDRTANPYASLNAASPRQGVVFYDLSTFGKVTLGPTSFPSTYTRTSSDGPGCSTTSLTIVVVNGDLTLNSIGSGGSTPAGLVASIFVPDGSYEGAGSVQIIGTMFAKEIKLTGTQDFTLDECFVQNPPSALLDVRVTAFEEDDD